jgi:hypothetical protein
LSLATTIGSSIVGGDGCLVGMSSSDRLFILICQQYQHGLSAVLAAQLGTPRGRYDEHNGKFPSIVKPRFNQPVGERNHFWRLMLASFWQGALSASSARWNLHTTQPKYFAPTCSEVVNLTGLL